MQQPKRDGVMRVYAPDGFLYNPHQNRVRCYLNGNNVSREVAAVANAFYAGDAYGGEPRFHLTDNGESMVVPGCESFWLSDLCCCFEDIFKFRVEGMYDPETLECLPFPETTRG